MYDDKSDDWTLGDILKVVGTAIAALVVITALIFGLMFGSRAYTRYQRVQDANNAVKVTAIQIRNTTQLVQVENEKAKVRVAEANGIADAQGIINDTLTPLYLQHEAISAQLAMAHSENHTIVYIPTGNEGIPLVGTVNTTNPESAQQETE